MDTSTPAGAVDPVTLLERLDPAEIRSRLEAMERERKALLVLLRAAQRRQKTATRLEFARG